MAGGREAIIQTLFYSSLFNFPLTKTEIYYYLHSDKNISVNEFEGILSLLKNKLIIKDEFYALAGHESSIKSRKSRIASSALKKEEGFRIAKILGRIPTVLFIGITGSVAVDNARDSDDIDIFMVTRRNCLYTTRLVSLLILQVLGKRRRKNEMIHRNKICLNMLVDEVGMDFSKSKDIYTARELLQMYPLFERDSYYKKLLKKNKWTRTLLPNALGRDIKIFSSKKYFEWQVNALESFCRTLELKLIKRDLTSEVVTKHVIALHPSNTKHVILEKIKNNRLHYNKYYGI